jgi:ABC-type Fe3+ transport system permease subunit
MIVYVSGDDDYYLGDASRWDSREEHLITVVAIAACALAAGVGAWCSTRTRRPRWAVWLALTAPPVAVALWVAAYIANTAN